MLTENQNEGKKVSRKANEQSKAIKIQNVGSIKAFRNPAAFHGITKALGGFKFK